MRHYVIAAACAAALALGGCASIPPERIESDIARIERGIDLASALAESAAVAGVLDERSLARMRSAVMAARRAIAMARDSAERGDKARAAALAREADVNVGGVAAELTGSVPERAATG